MGHWHVRGSYRTGDTREPRYLAERLCSRAEIVYRNTRQSDQLHFNKVRLEIGRRGFSHFGPKLYNGLPCDIKLLKGRHFKLQLKKHLFSLE
ncbi:hypothetical protein J6590_052964 [Homalodisca vitripennis]|nr:hypothetical protein J6590_052964 [Homalodisca vitripennis]